MDMFTLTSTSRTDIERQAIDHLEAHPEIDATTLVGQLDFDHWLRDDEYPEWHSTEPIEPMIRALFIRELMDCRNPDAPYTKTDHERRMRDPDVAEQFGFDLDTDEKSPCRTTYDRTWDDRLAMTSDSISLTLPSASAPMLIEKAFRSA